MMAFMNGSGYNASNLEILFVFLLEVSKRLYLYLSGLF